MTFYIQTGENNRITDVVTCAADGYTEVELSTPLPVSVLGGAYELRGNMIIYRPEWDTNERIEQLEADVQYVAIMTGVDL